MIQFAINKAYFLQALHTTRRAISSKNAIPILSTIKISYQRWYLFDRIKWANLN